MSNHEMSLFCLCPHVNKVDRLYPIPYGQAILHCSFFGWRFSKSALCWCLTRKKQRLLVIMFIPDFMCYIVQSISIAIISKFQRFFALM